MTIPASRVLATLMALAAATQGRAQDAPPAPDAAPAAKQVDTTDQSDIVVTAQRREERLQDVPIAVTALSGPALVSRQISSVVDIMSTVPNLHASNNIGQGSATTAFIRLQRAAGGPGVAAKLDSTAGLNQPAGTTRPSTQPGTAPAGK